MGRKKKEDRVGTSLGELLEDVELPDPTPAKAPIAPRARTPTPAPSRGAARGDERTAFRNAMTGVVPIDGAAAARVSRVPRDDAHAEEDARARLAALVGGGVHFTIERSAERVFGSRGGVRKRALRELESRSVSIEGTLDLHGMRAAAAARELTRFVRAQHRRGRRRLLVVHGKGLHSEGGVGVLGARVVEELTAGGAAPLVLAFASAHPDLGGTGALIVQLVR